MSKPRKVLLVVETLALCYGLYTVNAAVDEMVLKWFFSRFEK